MKNMKTSTKKRSSGIVIGAMVAFIIFMLASCASQVCPAYYDTVPHKVTTKAR
jgi:hypothetical protein